MQCPAHYGMFALRTFLSLYHEYDSSIYDIGLGSIKAFHWSSLAVINGIC